MRRDKKSSEIKELLRIKERIGHLNHEMRSQIPRPLPKKIFVGHWRHFSVRADILRSSIGTQVQQVVDACDHWVRGDKKDVRSFRANTEILMSATIAGYQGVQYLRPLNQDAWDMAGFPEFFKRKWFDVHVSYIRAGTKNIPCYKYFPKVPPYMLEFAYRPAYITEETIPDGDVASELQRLYDFMERERGWARLGERNRDEWDLSLTKKRMLKDIAKRETREAMDDGES